MRYSLYIFTILFLVNTFQPVYSATTSTELNFGVVPQQSASTLFKVWNPVLLHINKALGIKLKFVTAPSISEFEARCHRGVYDIAYMNPYHYIRFAQAPGYRVIANQSNKKLMGIFVVHKDSNIKSLEDLNGKAIYLPSPNAFAASLLTQSILRQRGIKFTAHFAGSHDAVYRNISLGIAPVGGGIIRTFNTQPAQLKAQLRILETTEGYTPHAIAVHPRLQQTLANQIQQALLTLPADLRAPLRFNPLQVAKDSDYDDIRALNIDNLHAPASNAK